VSQLTLEKVPTQVHEDKRQEGKKMQSVNQGEGSP
jgi:hypothetical protein